MKNWRTVITFLSSRDSTTAWCRQSGRQTAEWGRHLTSSSNRWRRSDDSVDAVDCWHWRTRRLKTTRVDDKVLPLCGWVVSKQGWSECSYWPAIRVQIAGVTECSDGVMRGRLAGTQVSLLRLSYCRKIQILPNTQWRRYTAKDKASCVWGALRSDHLACLFSSKKVVVRSQRVFSLDFCLLK